MVYDPMTDVLKNIDKQLEAQGVTVKDVQIPTSANADQKIPREEKSKKVSKKKMGDLDKYLIFAFTSLLLYTIAAVIVFIFTREEMAVLTGCFFAAFGGEILMCALIKRLKLHTEVKLKKEEDNGY